MIVIDTNIVSFIFGRDDRARYYLERIQGLRAIISFQTLEEMWYGAYSNGWGERRRSELARNLDQYETVWTNPELTHTCARLRSERRSAGREMPMADAWIAATAIMLECPLASHDHGFADIPQLELVQAP